LTSDCSEWSLFALPLLERRDAGLALVRDFLDWALPLLEPLADLDLADFADPLGEPLLDRLFLLPVETLLDLLFLLAGEPLLDLLFLLAAGEPLRDLDALFLLAGEPLFGLAGLPLPLRLLSLLPLRLPEWFETLPDLLVERLLRPLAGLPAASLGPRDKCRLRIRENL
jgi:hypothetical protein